LFSAKQQALSAAAVDAIPMVIDEAHVRIRSAVVLQRDIWDRLTWEQSACRHWSKEKWQPSPLEALGP
jgi:hypothetical protein